MAKLTITQAKKILGKAAEGISDEQLEQDIRAAELLKNLYFQQVLRKNLPQSSYNKTNNGKT